MFKWSPSFLNQSSNSDNVPFYYSPKPSLITSVSDHILALAAPVVAYWIASLIFHFFDTCNWKWVDKYRIHESSEVQSRNRASRSDVVWAVLFQQVLQTALGAYWFSGDVESTDINHQDNMKSLAQTLGSMISRTVGNGLAGSLLESQGVDVVYYLYWWGIPMAQFLFALFFIDTWQYFLHRLMHMNKFLYKHIHSVHHRLYVPYAFGSLYNHPIEGFILDSLGAAIAETISGMTTRQAVLFFSFSTLKTVDDHCGYRLPFDPLQWLSSNNADYHDMHHQTVGIKSNFSQPFFIHWDVLLGTRLTRQEVEVRRQKYKEKLT